MQRLQDNKASQICDITEDTRVHHNNHLRIREEGRTTFAQVFTLAVIVLVGVQGMKFIAPWYDDLRLQGAMEEAVHQAQLSTDGEMTSAVLAKAQDLKMPLTSRDIHVERNGPGGVRLWAEYNVKLTFPLGFSHTQSFRPDVRSGHR